MHDRIFEIGAEGVDTEALVARIRARVADKTERGAYTDAAVARAERTNLAALRDDDEFMGFYLDCLRDAAFVDIGDFEILERRRTLAPLLVALKRLIWKLLKFYTYRLWSQQNQINGMLVTAVEAMETRYGERLRRLEARLNTAAPGDGNAPGHDA
ncbi:MAG: hypothetical protein JW951_03530 [Lentisphaerae bacterium]|nr:hypothetical protein [Lentisphaerota bacterium]